MNTPSVLRRETNKPPKTYNMGAHNINSSSILVTLHVAFRGGYKLTKVDEFFSQNYTEYFVHVLGELFNKQVPKILNQSVDSPRVWRKNEQTRDGTAKLVSRNLILMRERVQGKTYFHCSADHEQDWQPYVREAITSSTFPER